MKKTPKAPLRERMSDALLEGTIERTLELQEMELRLATISPATPGYDTAQAVVRRARFVDRMLLWLGWRLQPRTMALTDVVGQA